MKIRLGISVVLLAVLALLCGCPMPGGGKTAGSLSIRITNSIGARTLLPSIDMTAASYTVSGSGPGGASFSQSTAGGSLTISGLAFGSWTITVNGLNAGGTVIGSGMGSAVVHTGATTEVGITVSPLGGEGTLSLSVSWNGAQVEAPSIEAWLMAPSGTPMSLAFGVEGSRGSFSSSAIAAGYYTLSLQ